MKYVYCHPLFDERKCAHRFSYRLKNTFEKAGLTLERFDYRGTGEAPGQFADLTLVSLRKDIAERIAGSNVCLIGLRFGASLALDYCARGQGLVERIVLIEPIVDGHEYLDYLRRKQRIKDVMTGASPNESKEDDYENLEGYKTSLKFLEQLKNFNLIEQAREYTANSLVFIVNISNTSKLDSRLKKLAKSLEGSAKQVVLENTNVPMFWERIGDAEYTELTQKVLRWCCG